MNVNDSKNNKDILDEILNIEKNINRLQLFFVDKESQRNRFELVNELQFQKEKLELLSETLLNEQLKDKCKHLLRNLKIFLKENKAKDYELKMKTLNVLADLTKYDVKTTYMELSSRLGEIAVLIALEDEAENFLEFIGLIQFSDLNLYIVIEDLRLKKIGVFRHIHSYSRPNKMEDISKLSNQERDSQISNLLNSLFQYVANSYNKNNSPFILEEKIMIVSMIQDIQEYILLNLQGD